MAPTSFRVRLQFDLSFENVTPRKCWFLIDQGQCATLLDLRKQIRRRFSLKCSKSDIVFKMDDFVLLPEESIEILRDSDLVFLTKVTKKSTVKKAVSNEDDKVIVPSQSKLNGVHTKKRKIENDVNMPTKKRKEQIEEPYLHPVAFDKSKKKKREKEKKRQNTETAGNTGGSSISFKSIRKSLKQKLETKKDNNARPLPKNSTFIVPTSVDIETISKVGKSHSSSKKGKRVNDKNNISCLQTKKLNSTYNAYENQGKHHNTNNGATVQFKKILPSKKDEKKQGGKTKTCNTNKSFEPLLSSVTAKDSPGAKGLNSSSLVKNKDIITCKFNGKNNVKDIAFSKRSKSSHLFFSSDGEEEEIHLDKHSGSKLTKDNTSMTTNDKQLLLDPSESTGSTLTKKGKFKQKSLSPGKDLCSKDIYTHSSIIVTNTFSPSFKSNITECKRTLENREFGRGDCVSAPLIEDAEVKKQKVLAASGSFDEVPLFQRTPPDYSVYPKLDRAPKAGDLIAFKMIELSLSYTPEVSNFKEAAVISYEAETDTIELELSESSLKKSVGDGSISRKFELIDETDEQEEEPIENTIQDRKITLSFKELLDVKLIM